MNGQPVLGYIIYVKSKLSFYRKEEKKQEHERAEVEAVIFVPSTPGGELVKRMQECDDNFREGTKEKKLKFVEIWIGSASTLEIIFQ